ncbi:MAG TPA: hypothetical protein VM717_09900 [Chthoniobacterales bacterium]|jgi:hypothetical protein|nr:hypothetical protein [Chthoniobacterales bacterium]
MKTTIPMRIRASRFLYERFRQRERPPYIAELLLWGLIVILATWPMLSLAAAIETLR